MVKYYLDNKKNPCFVIIDDPIVIPYDSLSKKEKANVDKKLKNFIKKTFRSRLNK